MAPTSEQARTAKTKLLAGGKAPKARVQRYLKSTESKLVEGARSSLLLKGVRCSEAMGMVLKDLRAMQAPHSKFLTKKNAIFPFDNGETAMEFLCTKNDCSLFAMASTNKKRPNNLLLGRMFDRHLLDMFELGLTRYKSLRDYGGGVPKKKVGSKPMMLFVGDLWQHDPMLRKLQNLLMDFHKGEPVKKLVATGLDHIMVFTVAEPPTAGALGGQEQQNASKPFIHQRVYHCQLKKNPNATGGNNAPLPFLTPCGPDMDFVVRRTQHAAPDLWRESLKQPMGVKARKTKNHSTNLFGETIGRLHLERQDIDNMQGRKSKALRRAEKAAHQEEQAALEEELKKEKSEMGQEFEQTYGFAEDETEKR